MHNFQTKNFQILQLKIPTRTVCISKCPVRGVAEGDLWHVEWYCSAGKVFIGLGFRPHFWPNFKTNFGQILTPALSESLSKGPGGPSPLHGPTVRRLFSFFFPAIARGPWRNKKPPAPVWEIERNTGQAKMLYQRSSFWNHPWTSHPPRISPTEKICPNSTSDWNTKKRTGDSTFLWHFASFWGALSPFLISILAFWILQILHTTLEGPTPQAQWTLKDILDDLDGRHSAGVHSIGVCVKVPNQAIQLQYYNYYEFQLLCSEQNLPSNQKRDPGLST